MPATPPADARRITDALGPDTQWGPVKVVDDTVSTNLDVSAAAADGAEPGLVVVSSHQRSGRGRFNREWVDTPDTAVAMSALVRPARPQAEWGWFSLAAGLAVAAAIRDVSGAGLDRVALKWPNDVLIDGRKICGILCESDGTNVVIGIGINTSMDTTELPVPTGTSLLLAGMPTDKSDLVTRVLVNLEEILGHWETWGDLRDDYLAGSGTIGQNVRVIVSETEVVEGRAVGVDHEGELLVETPDGVQSFAAGDVVHLRPGAAD